MDQTLEMALGATVKEVVYAYMRDEYNIKLETCYTNFEEFVKALREVLGESASIIIEKLVVKRLCAILNLKDVDGDCSLLDLAQRLISLKDQESTRIEKEV